MVSYSVASTSGPSSRDPILQQSLKVFTEKSNTIIMLTDHGLSFGIHPETHGVW